MLLGQFSVMHQELSFGDRRKEGRSHGLGRAGAWAVRFAGVFMGLNLLYVVLLTLVCALPATPGFRRHMKEASEVLFAETEYPKIGLVKLDNYTDSIVLDIAYSVDPAHPFRAAMAGVRTRYLPNTRPLPTFHQMFIERDSSQFQKEDYFRYWHGHMVLWRPLMMMFGFNEIRMLNGYIVLLLLAALAIGIYQKAGGWAVFAVATGYASLNVWVTPLSLQYMPVMLISLGGSLAALAVAKAGFLRQAMLVFVLGSVTAYLDLLAATLLTLGVPLLVMMAAGDGGRRIGQALGLPVFWAAGWAGTWTAKFVIALCMFEGAAQNIWETILFRLSARPGTDAAALDIPRSLAIQMNLEKMGELNRALLLVGMGIGIGVVLWKLGLAWRKRPVLSKGAWAYLVVGSYSFFWYALMANHSYIHKFMVYRLLAIPLMAVGLFLSPADKRDAE